MTLVKKIKAAFQPLSYAPTLESIELTSLGKLSYTLKRSARRRTLALQVKSQKVYVAAPASLPNAEIQAFIKSREAWLVDVLQQQQALPQNKMSYQNGAKLLLNGQWLNLELEPHNRPSIHHDFATSTLLISGHRKHLDNPVYIRKKLLEYVKNLAHQTIEPLVHRWAEQTGLTPTAINYKFYKNRWGCCYQSGEVRFNPLIIAAPNWVIDCIVIHELCHLEQMNHSRAFWALNDVHCGRCQAAKQWLKDHHYAMQLPKVKD